MNFASLRKALALVSLLALSACLFKTAEPVITPDRASPVLLKTGYLYEVSPKDGEVSAFKLERHPSLPSAYLFYDEDETKPPFLMLLADLGRGRYLVQMQNQHADAKHANEHGYEYSMIRVELGAVYVISENSERFSRFIEEQGVGAVVGDDRRFFPAVKVADRRRFIEAMKRFAEGAEFPAHPAYYDADAVKRVFPDKVLPK